GAANGGQPAPVVTSVTTSGGTTTIDGTLGASAASTQFRIEVFVNGACDASGKGEGEIFLGARLITTNGSGDGTFSLAVAALPAGQQVTATATNTVTNNTSQFSGCVGT